MSALVQSMPVTTTDDPEKGHLTLDSSPERTRQQPELGPYLSRLEWEAELMACAGKTVTVERVASAGSSETGNWLKVHGSVSSQLMWTLCLFEDGGWILEVTSHGGAFRGRSIVPPTTASQHVTATTEALVFARMLGVMGPDEAPAESSAPNMITDTCTR